MGTPTGSSLGNGDVIWVPQELVSGEPVEVDPAVRAELKALASGLGIVVVIAAGNGGAQVYDLPVTAEDSEAIVVGAGGSGTVSTAQERNYGNYGARVDCQGWGDHVLAVGVGGLVNGEQTSAACSMVAGIAAVVESVARRCSRGAISPAELRAALRDPNLGIPYQGSDPIGALPDLRRLLDHFGLWPDSFVRDHVGDDGTEPSSPSQMIWASPDIIPRLQVETNPGGTLGGTNWDLDLAESPAAGATCQLYVRLQNRSFVDHDVTVDLYWAYEGAWISPSEWHHIGAINAHSPGRDFTGVLSSPERVVAGPLAWPTPTDTTHPCLIAVLWSTVDLAALPGPMTSDVQYADFVREHNNVTHRNIILGEAIPQALYACAFTACMPRIDGGPPVLRPMPDNLHGARAFLGLGRGQPVRPRGAPALLSLDELAGPEALGIEQGAIRRAFDGDRRLGDRRAIPMPENWTPIHDGGDLVLEGLSPGESVPVVVLLRPPERPRAGSEIRIVQYQGDRPIGALTYRFGQAVLG
jgi:hypothetical protein